MSNLLTAGLYRLRKSRIFWICLIFMIGWAVCLGAGYWTNNYEDLTQVSFSEALFPVLTVMILVFAVFISMFLGTEYSDRTVHNKMVAGYKRSNIYLSEFLISGIACLIFYLTAYLISLGVFIMGSCILLGSFSMPLGEWLLYLGVGALMCLADAAIFVLIAMILGNKAVGAVISLISGLILLGASSNIFQTLSEEEYYYQPKAVYEAMDGDGENVDVVVVGKDMEMVKVPNPLYVSGKQRKIYEFLLDSNPAGQAAEIGSMKLQRPLLVVLYDFFEIFICCGAGILVFRRKDLK